MSQRSSLRRFGMRSKLLLSMIALLLGVLASPMAALAHAADAYLQATYITVAPAQIVVELDLTPGVLVAPEVLEQLDADGDQQISEAEGQAYVDAVLPKIELKVDGQPLALTITKIDMPVYLAIQAGYGTIRVFTAATLAENMTGTHAIAYTNSYAPTGAIYQVNAFVDKNVAITLGKQNRDSLQQSMTLDYAIDSATPATVTSIAAATSGATQPNTSFATSVGAAGQAERLVSYLYAPTLSPWVLLLGLALAGALGGLHALTPGHGKTLVAAYLVGSRGTVRHAVTLGAIVTFTHTASVIVIGLLALFASQYVVPDVLLPILTMLSGLLVVVLGARLIWQRWLAFTRRSSGGHSSHHDHAHTHSHDHDHDHTHDYDHDHDHDHSYAPTYTHDHGDGHAHSHLPPAGGITLSSLVAMGVSGGLVPCPEALGIMVIAIGLNRILLGLGLIVSFSFGLAAVLIVIGILLVRSRSLVERFGGIGSRWSSALPLASAVIVTVLGIGMTLSGLVTYLG